MSTASAVRVYLPQQCIEEDSGLLIGCVDKTRRIFCITGLVRHTNSPCEVLQQNLENCIWGIIGVWDNVSSFNEIEHHADDSIGSCVLALRVHRNNDKQLQAESKAFGLTTNVIVILFDSLQFISSVLVDTDVESSPDECKSNLHTIYCLFQLHRQFVVEGLKLNTVEARLSLRDFTRRRVSVISLFAEVILSRLLSVIVFFTNFCYHHSSCLSNSGASTLKYILETPAVFSQIQHKYNCLSLQAKEARKTRKCQLRFLSCISLFSIDVFVGTLLMFWLLVHYDTSDAAEQLLVFGETVATELDRLLQWMMGVPAGLKLNQPLAHFLGNFFLYHIFLWKAYLKALQPLAGLALTGTCLTGCLGVTVQLAIIQDILSMMTLHIYCFYVYAARLYCLQLNALSSLWRLFRGKKWNSLRNRVDSATYDIDQLFLGTLLFTVLLFLLPTTGLFYAVFALLRILVLVTHGIIMKLVSFINNLPVYWLLLRVFQPDVVSGNTHISIRQKSPLCFHLQLKPVSLGELYKLNTSDLSTSNRVTNMENSWKSLLGKLITGRLIYPWIEQTVRPP